MAFDISTHTPTESAKKRAEQAGLDIEQLRKDEPIQYAILNAVACLDVDNPLKDAVAMTLHQRFTDHQFFDLPISQTRTRLLCFPALTKEELKALGSSLYKLSDANVMKEHHAFFRVVNDQKGEHREFALPIAQANWQEEFDVMVGPFTTQELAEKWGKETIGPAQNAAYDTIPLNGLWFCDVFEGNF